MERCQQERVMSIGDVWEKGEECLGGREHYGGWECMNIGRQGRG